MGTTHFSRREFAAAGAAAIASPVLGRAQDQGASALSFAPALEAVRAIRSRAVSSVELTTHILSRIERHNPRVNAVATVLRDKALARAKAADEALDRGESWGPFHGVPFTIKDTFETAGIRTTAGATEFKDYVPSKDAAVVERMLRAGGVLIGKTNVPPMAMDWQSYNDIFGTTNNPWDLKRTPGGSTGGGAAALAAGLTYLCVGSDIGGSIRIPAHFCGVYGHKPTVNLVPTRGHIPPPPGGPPEPPAELNVAGPLARSAADLKAAVEALGGPDGDDAKAYRWFLPPARGASLRDYRIGFVLDDPLCPVSAEVTEVLSRVIAALRKAGANLKEGWPPGVVPQQQYDTYRYLLFSFLAPFLGPYQEQVETKDEPSHQAIIARAFKATYQQRREAGAERMKARAVWQEYFRTHDVFLLPTALVPAFPHDHGQTNQRRLATSQGPRDYMDLLFWISFATLTGLPATVAPAGLTRGGLPVGLQIIGPYLEDATPLDFAGKLADVVGGFTPPKGFA